LGANKWIAPLLPMFRATNMSSCIKRAFDYLDRGELRNAVASFVNNMNARPDCELPHHLDALGALLLMNNDALGWKALIEEFR
jgi:hypothetical protein